MSGPRNGSFLRGRYHPVTLGFYLTIGVLLAVVLGMSVASLSTVLIYLVFALVAALGLDPIVRYLVRRGIKRPWGIAIVFAVFSTILIALVAIIVPPVVEQIAQFIDSLPEVVDDFQRSSTYVWLTATFGASIPDVVRQVEAFLVDPNNIANIGGGVLQIGITIVSGVSGAVIVLVLTLYFLAALPMIKRSFVRTYPARSRRQVADLTEQVTNSVGGYLMGMVILAALNATVSLVLFLVLGMPFPVLFAVFALLVTLIPLVGSLIFWVTGSAIALFVSPTTVLVFALAYLIYMQIEAYFLTPRVMNRTISIPGALVVIGALVGGTLLGLLGALIAIPVTASLLLVYKQVVQPIQDAKN